MFDPAQPFPQPGELRANLFPPTSRYHGVEIEKLEAVEGEPVVYLARRFVPQTDRFAVLQEYTVVQGDRLDLIAFRHLGDPEQFWRLCDANGVLRPDELEEPGRVVRITLPENVPGGPEDA
jgi:hypothetical protein